MNLSKQNGVSLIEVLITALILAVGLLGVAALQVTSINSNQSGYFRSQATEIAENLASRIRAARMTTYDGSTTLAQVVTSYQAGPYGCAGAVTSCITGSCLPVDLVNFDIYEVCKMAETELPEGQVYVVPVGGIRSRIAVAWTPVAARQDLGQSTIVNNQCAGLGIGIDKDCIILEIIP